MESLDRRIEEIAQVLCTVCTHNPNAFLARATDMLFDIVGEMRIAERTRAELEKETDTLLTNMVKDVD